MAIRSKVDWRRRSRTPLKAQRGTRLEITNLIDDALTPPAPGSSQNVTPWLR